MHPQIGGPNVPHDQEAGTTLWVVERSRWVIRDRNEASRTSSLVCYKLKAEANRLPSAHRGRMLSGANSAALLFVVERRRRGGWVLWDHSMTSSARPSSGSGIVKPSVLAVFMLMISSTFTACCTGKIGRLLALENPARVDADKTIHIDKVGAVTHQAAGRSGLAPWIARRNCMPCRQLDELFAVAGEEWVGRDDECTGVPLGCREGRF